MRKVSQNYFTDKTAENLNKKRNDDAFCQLYENKVVIYTIHNMHYEKIVKSILVCFLALSMTGCATVFGGPITAYQKTKPLPGQPQREIRVGALIADILLFLPSTIVDFATGAIYRPK